MVIFAAIIGIPAAIIANDSSNQHSPVSGFSSGATPTQSASPTPDVTNSSPSSSPSIPHSPTPSGRRDATRPPTQSSYLLQWQGTRTIGPAGVNVDRTGIYTSDGETYDLQYQPENSGGWRTVVSAEIAFFYWLSKSTPRPESCVGLTDGSGTLPDPTDKVAHINDRYCFVDFNVDPTVVAYMRVTSVGANSVTVKVQLWDHR